ncbi:MAG TPA: hypothetical protein VNA57_12590 [Acidimicrobiales bacterium]|nr:hypothetical protein [Acidimicrobiales bacterium]
MEAQLVLLEDEDLDWRLDEVTRERGRQGVASARAALQKVPSQVPSAA